MSNHWLKDLRNKMEDHTGDVPDGLWDDIKSELFDKEEENSIIGLPMEEHKMASEEGEVSSSKKIRPLVYRIAGIAAAIALLFFVAKQLLNFDEEVKPISNISSSKKADDLKMQGHGSDVENSSTKNGENADFDHYSSKKIVLAGSAALRENVLRNSLFRDINRSEKIDQNLLQGATVVEPLISLHRQYTGITQNKIPHIEDGGRSINHRDEIDELISETEIGLQNKSVANTTKDKKRKSNSSWMLSMLTGKASSNSQQFPGYATMSGQPLMFNEMFSASGYEQDPFMQVLVANQSQNVEATVRHKVPLNLGVSLYYNLGKRWGIGTGINYTKLSSELHSGSQSNFVKSEQTVHYIGIPVQVNYNVIQKGRFTGYVTGGALIEKSVAGNFTTKYVVDNVVNDETKERLPSQPVQVSLNTALGVQLKLIDKIGVYAEPGIGYHFKDDGSLNTIYKEKPLNLNVKFGIRVLLN